MTRSKRRLLLELVGKVFQKVVLLVQLFQFMVTDAALQFHQSLAQLAEWA